MQSLSMLVLHFWLCVLILQVSPAQFLPDLWDGLKFVLAFGEGLQDFGAVSNEAVGGKTASIIKTEYMYLDFSEVAVSRSTAELFSGNCSAGLYAVLAILMQRTCTLCNELKTAQIYIHRSTLHVISTDVYWSDSGKWVEQPCWLLFDQTHQLKAGPQQSAVYYLLSTWVELEQPSVLIISHLSFYLKHPSKWQRVVTNLGKKKK